MDRRWSVVSESIRLRSHEAGDPGAGGGGGIGAPDDLVEAHAPHFTVSCPRRGDRHGDSGRKAGRGDHRDHGPARGAQRGGRAERARARGGVSRLRRRSGCAREGALGRGRHLLRAARTSNPSAPSAASGSSRRATGPWDPTRMLLSKPVIAAVAGYAVAGGLELALWCDLRVMEETATFGVFCRRWGVPLLDGGTVRLPRLIGLSRALDLILTGRPVDARRRCTSGLPIAWCRRVRPAQRRRRWRGRWPRLPPQCLRSDRRSALRELGDGSRGRPRARVCAGPDHPRLRGEPRGAPRASPPVRAPRGAGAAAVSAPSALAVEGTVPW